MCIAILPEARSGKTRARTAMPWLSFATDSLAKPKSNIPEMIYLYEERLSTLTRTEKASAEPARFGFACRKASQMKIE
jgi:hypothetical protein